MMMLLRSLAGLIALPFAPPPPAPALPPSSAPTARVTVDSTAHTVTVDVGPFDVPAMAMDAHDPAMAMSAMMAAGHGQSAPLMRFDWPIDGWVRGVRLVLSDPAGARVPREVVHHVNIVNFARRQLFYDVPERLLAMGTETEDITLPRSIGVPVSRGMPMAVLLMWHNMTHTDFDGVHLSLVIDWEPSNLMPRPMSVLPLYMNVVDPVGRAVDFDLPAGRHSFHADFTMPLSGRIVAVGGHLHDFGTAVRLEEYRDSRLRPVVALTTRLAPNGSIEQVERKYPGISGRGIKLEQGHRYRMSGVYDNPTGHDRPHGAMVHLIALFAPHDMRHWPAVDTGAADFARDVSFLEGN